MSLRKQVVQGVVWSGVQNWGDQAITFIIFIVLARLLTPEIFGLVALAGVYIAFVMTFLDQGFADAIVQRDRLNPGHLDTAFWTNLGVGASFMLLSLGLAGPVASLFGEPQLAPIIMWLSLRFLFDAWSGVPKALFRRELAFRTLAVRALTATSVGGIVGVGMALSGFGVWSLVGQQLVSGFVGALVLWWSSSWRPGFNISPSHFKELFAFGISVVGTNVLNFFNRRMDNLIIGYFLGPVALGYYTVGYRVLKTLTQLLTSTVSSVAFPAFSRLQGDGERMRRGFYEATQMVSLIAFPAFLGMAAVAPDFVVGVFGEKWAPSIPVMQVLALIGILHSVFYFNDTVIKASGKPAWVFGLNALNAVTNTIAFIVAVQWGIVAVAAAYVMRGYLLSPIPLWVLHRLIHLDFGRYFRQYAVSLAGSAAMVVGVFGVKSLLGDLMSLHASLILQVAIGALVYAATILLVAPALTRQALEWIRLAIPLKIGDRA